MRGQISARDARALAAALTTKAAGVDDDAVLDIAITDTGDVTIDGVFAAWVNHNAGVHGPSV